MTQTTKHSPYRVARNSDGSIGWWENWNMPIHQKERSREATPEETHLMDAIIRLHDTSIDRQRLRKLLDENT